MFKRIRLLCAAAVTVVITSVVGVAGGVFFPTSAPAAPTPCSVGIGIQITPQIFEGATSTLSPSQALARVGDTIDYVVEVFMSPTACSVTAGDVTLTLPNGNVDTLDTSLSLAASGTQTYDAQLAGFPYVVSDADIGNNGAPVDNVRALTAVTATAHKSDGTTQTTGANANYDIPVIHPETTLTKSVSPSSGRVPLTVTDTFTEANVSSDPSPYAADDGITGSSIVITDTDSACTPITFVSSSDGNTTTLDAGATWTYHCSETFSTKGTFSDSATATGNAVGDQRPEGTSASDGAPSSEASNSVTVTALSPSTTLTETANPTSGRAPLPVTFTYTETNTGTDPITSVVVTSTACPGGATFVSSSDGDTTDLNPGAHWTFTCSKTLTAAGLFTDSSSATGTDTVDGLPAPTTGESASASATAASPSTMLIETANPTSGRTPLPVTFTYTETNTGTDPLTSVVVTSTACPGGATFVSSSDGDTTDLNPGAHWTFTCSKTLTAAGLFTDSSSATGTDTVDGLPAPTTGESASASATATSPSTTLTETANPTSGRTPLPVTFTYTETNTGTDPITSVVVTSTACPGGATFVSSSDGDTTDLNPGAHWTFTCSKTLTAAGLFTDSSSATGTDTVDGQPAPATGESASASATATSPSTTLTETANPTSGRAPLSVTFTYTETNTGTDPITSVVVTSTACPGGATFVSSSDGNITDLNPGAHWTFTCTITLTSTGTYTDSSSATGTDTVDGLPAPTAGESTSANVTVASPSTTLTETANPTSGRAPLSVTFTYVETNTGSDPITSVVVTSTACPGGATFMSSSDGDTTDLNPGAHWTFTCTITLTSSGTYTDSSSATGTDTVDGQPAPATNESASARVTVSSPSTTLTETANPTSGRAPRSVTFTYVETNTGTDPITSVAVTSTACPGGATFMSSSDGDTTDLNPGAHWTFTCTITLTSSGTYTDSSSATGTDTVDGQPAPATNESASARVTVSSPSTTLTETANPTTGTPPLAVTFTYVETNTGTDPITGVAVTATACPGGATLVSSSDGDTTDLNPGAHWTFTCSITLTSTGTYTDDSSATGTDTVDGLPAPDTNESASARVTVSPPSTLTLTPGFWKNHQAATTALLPLDLGNYVVSTFDEARGVFETMNCSNHGPQNAVGCLSGQLLAAELNVANGTNTCIGPTITAADAFLVSVSYVGPSGTYPLTSAQRSLALSLDSTLSTYNSDNLGIC